MTDYTRYDYDELVERITESLKDKPGFTDSYESSTSQTLIQLLADVNDHLFYMLERRTQESFIDTAKLDSSIITHASELGYRPRRKVSASGTVLLELIDTDGDPIQSLGNIFIPRGTQVLLDDVSFVTTEDYVISQNQSSVEMNIKEGTSQTISFSASDPEFTESLDITIESFIDIEEFSIEVIASNGEYMDVGSEELLRQNLTTLSYALPQDRVYDVKFSKDGMRIIFGDNEFGKTPEGQISIRYIKSSGSDISVVRTGLEFSLSDLTLIDDTGDTPTNIYNYSLTNITQIRGGSDGESTAEIARNAPSYVRTNSRAITAFDHEFWTLRSGIGGIADCRAFGEQESESLVFNMNNVIIGYITADGLPMTPEQKMALGNYLDNFKILTTHIAFHQVNRFTIIPHLKYRSIDNFPISNSAMYEYLQDMFEDYFTIRRGIIGKNFQRSELIRDIQNMQITISGTTYNPTDYLDLEIEVEYLIEDPDTFYEIYLSLPNYTPVAGHRWTLFVNEDTYTVDVLPDDTINSMIERMRNLIQDGNVALVAALIDEDNQFESLLRIKSRFFDGVFPFSIDTTDDIHQNTMTSNIIRIPLGGVCATGNTEKIIAGSAYILDESDNIIFQDNGEGQMVDPSGVIPSFEIDYENADLISPQLSQSSVRMRFKQSPVHNIYPGVNGAVLFDKFEQELNEAPNPTIEFLE